MDNLVFLQDLQSQVTNLSLCIGKTIDNFMNSAKIDMPFEIDREKFIGAIPVEIRVEVQKRIPDRLFALTFNLKAPEEKLNYSWLSSKIFQAERLYGSEIYTRKKEIYGKMAQFDKIDQPARLLAFGGDSKAALKYVLDNERKFNPDMFDEDGFTISG